MACRKTGQPTNSSRSKTFMPRLEILGLPLDPVDMDGAVATIGGFLNQEKTRQVITLNPEIAVRAQQDGALANAIREADLVTADGVGIVWAARRLCGRELKERVTGVDLTLELLRRYGPKLRVYLLGARPGVAERAAERIHALFGTRIAGTQHGFFENESDVLAGIRAKQPDLLLVGMGEKQDLFIHRNKANLGAKVAIGVGGTIDVLAGEVQRIPAWAQKLKIEWFLRVGLDPKRWKRIPRLLEFIRLVLRARS